MKLFSVYVQTYAREQYLASDVSKKKKKVFRKYAVAKPQGRIIYQHQQTELTASVVGNVKVKEEHVEEEELLLLAVCVCIESELDSNSLHNVAS